MTEAGGRGQGAGSRGELLSNDLQLRYLKLKYLSIVLEKIPQSNVNLDDFLKELETLEPDPNQPTMEEISQIVKDVRREYSNYE